MQDKNRPLRLLMLLSLTLLATGCASKPESWQPPPVAPPSIPALPNEAKQPTAPPWCSPSCSAGLTRERESSLNTLTQPE